MFFITQFALPHNQNSPASRLKCGHVATISKAIRVELRHPELVTGLGDAGKSALWIGMAMPKAAVNEDSLALARKNEVWPTGKILPVQAEPVAQFVDKSAHYKFRLRIPPLNAAHTLAALLRR